MIAHHADDFARPEQLEPRTLMDSSLASLPREILETRAEIESVVTADFNGDGRTDIAVASGRDVLVLLRNPRFGYADPIVTRLAQRAGQLQVARLDGNDRLDLIALGGRTGGGTEVVLRALLGRGDGRFTIADRMFVAAASSEPIAVVADVIPGGLLENPRDEIIVAASPRLGAIFQSRMAVFRFNSGKGGFDEGVIVSTTPGTYVRPVFYDLDGDRDLDIITAANTAGEGVVIGITMPAAGDELPPQVLITRREGRIDSLLHGDLGDGRGARLFIAYTEPDDDSHFFTATGDSVIESIAPGGGGGDPVELLRRAGGELNLYGEPVDRTITLQNITDVNGDGVLDIVGQETFLGPRPADAALVPGVIWRETALLQLVAPSSAEGGFVASSSHNVGGTSRAGRALSAIYGTRYLVGDLAGTGAADLIMFRDSKLLLGLGDASQKAPIVSRIEPAEILPAVVGAFGFSAAGVYDPDQVRGGYVALVRAYVDINRNGRLDASDPLVGIDQDGSDGWTFGGIAPADWGREAGRKFLVVAQDDRGVVGPVFSA